MIRIFLPICFFMLAAQQANAQNLVINEVLAANASINTDEDGDHEDWIELYNKGISAVSLSGYSLSDDALQPQKWVLPNVSIAAGNYLLVWASDKDRKTIGQPLHTNFKITSDGEKIWLFAPNGTVVDTITTPELSDDISYARAPNGTGGFAFQNDVTPKSANPGSGFVGTLPKPTFSVEGGFYTAVFNLSITTNVPNAQIIYTIDGSEPDAGNLGGTTYNYRNIYRKEIGQTSGPMLTQSYKSFTYSQPLSIIDRTSQPNTLSAISSTFDNNPNYIPAVNVFKGTVVKAMVIKSGYLPSKVETHTYFISEEGTARFSMPVISISMNPDKLFDYEDGIYVAGKDYDNWYDTTSNIDVAIRPANYNRSGNDAERSGNFSYFENGEEKLNQEVGFRVSGQASRAIPIKTFQVFARDSYGKSTMDHDFFGSGPDDYKRLLLRNAGTDAAFSYFRDAFMQRLVNHMDVITQDYKPAVSFVNGEYWGILNLREKYDKFHFEQKYGIDEDSLDLLENIGDEIIEGENNHYLALLDYVGDNDLTVPSNYAKVDSMMDIRNYLDYQISEIYVANNDWIFNNMSFFRKRTTFMANAPLGQDGRWRWLLWDLDGGFGLYEPVTHLSLFRAIHLEPASSPKMVLINKLLENDGFKHQFINRFADMLNTTFLPTRVVGMIDGMKGVLAEEMPEHIQRWERPFSMAFWNESVQSMKDFAAQRPAIQRQHILDEFGLQGTYTTTLKVSDTNHGHIKINTIDIAPTTVGVSASPYPWSGQYFKSIPIQLTAIPKSGYTFSHWSGASTSSNPQISLTSSNNIDLTAHFVATTVNACSPDVTSPTLVNCPDNITRTTSSASSTATWTAPTATDNCPGNVTLTSTHMSGDNFAIGSTTVTYTAQDASNNTATCSFKVTVTQQVATTCANNLAINSGFENGLTAWSGNGSTSADAYSGGSALRINLQATAVKQTINAIPGETYTLSAFGKKEATATGNIRIKFKDGADVTLSEGSVNINTVTYKAYSKTMLAPPNTAYIEVGCFNGLTPGAVWMDEVCLTKTNTAQPPPVCNNNLASNAGFESGLNLWVGNGQISPDANSGNVALRISLQATAVKQVLSAVPGDTYTLSAFAKKDATATANLRMKFKNSAGVTLSEGSVNIHATTYTPYTKAMVAPPQTSTIEVAVFNGLTPGAVWADDFCLTKSNTAPNPCSPDLTVPTITNCPANISQTTTTSSASATWTAPTASDNCPGMVTLTATHTSGASFPIGSTTVIYTAKDASNNTATCSFKVTVTSLVPPMITLHCPSNITEEVPIGQTGKIINFSAPVGTSTCPTGAVNTTRILGQPSGSFFPIGITSVCYRATDGCNNTKTCCFQVVVTIGFDNGNLVANPGSETAYFLEHLSLYPNPASGVVYLAGGLHAPEEDGQLSISDMYGRQVLATTVNFKEKPVIEVPLTDFADGVYVVRVEFMGVRAFTRPLVVIR